MKDKKNDVPFTGRLVVQQGLSIVVQVAAGVKRWVLNVQTQSFWQLLVGDAVSWRGVVKHWQSQMNTEGTNDNILRPGKM